MSESYNIHYEAVIVSYHLYPFQMSLFCSLNDVKITKNLQEGTYFLDNTVYSSKLNLEEEISLENVISPHERWERNIFHNEVKKHTERYLRYL
jgi:hypothetical protein